MMLHMSRYHCTNDAHIIMTHSVISPYLPEWGCHSFEKRHVCQVKGRVHVFILLRIEYIFVLGNHYIKEFWLVLSAHYSIA